MVLFLTPPKKRVRDESSPKTFGLLYDSEAKTKSATEPPNKKTRGATYHSEYGTINYLYLLIHVKMLVLPFDAHNHIHMGASPPQAALGQGETTARLGGLAIMSTHPRDFARVLELSESLPLLAVEQSEMEEPLRVVPCFGIHPWWLAELTDEDWPHKSTTGADADASPQWLRQMETLLTENPNSIVGEIGLDGFHFDPDTRELSCPMETQVRAFELQMQLAARLQRPVSIHTVQCFGPLMNALSRLKKKGQLPPRVYFHAFGGKVGTVDQVLALCGRKLGQVYFGFAPVVSECRVELT